MAEIEKLIAKLGDPDPIARANAARALWNASLFRADVTAAIPVLADALSDGSKGVREDAARALASAACNGADISDAIPALAKAVSEKDWRAVVQEAACEALGKAVFNEESRDAALSALAKAVSEGNADVRAYAVRALRENANQGLDISATMPALAKALSDGNVHVRDTAAWAFAGAASHEIDISSAIPALAKALYGETVDGMFGAVRALNCAAGNGTDITVAIPALAKALFDSDAGIRTEAARILGPVIEGCITAKQLNKLETMIREGHCALKDAPPYRRKEKSIATGSAFSGLMNQIARRRNELALQRDILLNDIPKPQKAGVIYQGMKGALRHG